MWAAVTRAFHPVANCHERARFYPIPDNTTILRTLTIGLKIKIALIKQRPFRYKKQQTAITRCGHQTLYNIYEQPPRRRRIHSSEDWTGKWVYM